MLYESGQDFTIGKSGGNAGRISQITSSVVAYIDNQSVAGCQIDKISSRLPSPTPELKLS